MTRPRWITEASRTSVAIEAGLVAFVLVLALTTILRPSLGLELPASGSLEPGWAAFALGLIYAGYTSAIFAGLRMRRVAGAKRRWIRYELAGAALVILALWAGATIAHLIGVLWIGRGWPENHAEVRFLIWAPVLGTITAIEPGIVYLCWRGLILIWPAWSRLRRRRLLWALTNAQLVASLILSALIAILLTIFTNVAPTIATGDVNYPEHASADVHVLVWVTSRALPVMSGLLLLGAAASAVLLPMTAVVSYLILRQTARSLEELALATDALRSGDLTARVPVASEDEVGRLQADFNAMAEALKTTLEDLQAERDRVAGLLDARRQLIATVSHELRTPVATIRGYLESALHGGHSSSPSAPADADAWRGDLEVMEREIQRLQGRIDELFTLSRAEVGKLELRLEPVDVGDRVQRLVETVAPLVWRQQRVEVLAEIQAGLPPGKADTERLDQIVSNLLSNAVHHTPPGGLVIVGVKDIGDMLEITVKDTGEGISLEDLPNIFDRFFRGSGESGSSGAGLGLALAKDLVEAFGGSIEASSTQGEGSCFTVHIPKA